MRTLTRMGIMPAVLFMAACGSGSNGQSSAALGPAGGVITTENVRVDVPAGALQSNTEITVQETQPSGIVRRVDIQPHSLTLGNAARVSIKDDGSQGPMKLVAFDGQHEWGLDHCCHDAGWHEHSGEVTQLQTVDLRHAKACDPACPADQVCDDGVCNTPDAFCSQCGPACGPSGCNGWMCGCNGGMCGCDGRSCCHDGWCCDGGMCGGGH